MALVTYSDLTAAIASWLARTDLTVDDLVTLAEAEIYRRLRVREMETTTTLTVSTQSTALPSGFIGIRRFYLSTNPLTEPQYLSPQTFWKDFRAAQSSTNGVPKIYTIEGDNLVVAPSPDSSYSGPLLYYQKLAALSSASNSLWTRNPDMWLFGSLAQAGMFIQDDSRVAMWAQRFDAICDSVQGNSNNDRFSGAPIRVTADVMTP